MSFSFPLFPVSSQQVARPQPKTKNELKTWIEEYCEGVKNHGEPNTWDVTLVTDMSWLFGKMKKFNAPIDQWNTSQVTDMNNMFMGADAMTHPKPSGCD